MLSLLLLIACEVDTSLIEQKDDPCTPEVWYPDGDGDGFGAGEPEASCEPLLGYSQDGGDCDDADAMVSPAGEEVCDGVDNDCNGAVDDGAEVGQQLFYADEDGDRYGGAEVWACEQPDGTVLLPGDCDDADAAVFPGADEVCNGVDDDCDGDVDSDAVDAPTWYWDGDADGWGVPDPDLQACERPEGYADNPDDCDDTVAELNEDCTPEPPEGTSACQGTLYTWVSSSPSEPELNVLSVYEADGGHGGPPGNIAVTIERPTEMELLLSSYEPVDWTVTVAQGTTLRRILVNGYHTQTVSGPSGVPVEIRTYDTTQSNFGYWCGYSWPYNGGGCDTNPLLSGVQAYTGLATTSFTGCYHATAFRLR